MTWTTRTPTQPGYWWFRERTDDLWRVVYVYNSNGGLCVSEDVRAAPISMYSGGEWSSEPIKEPEEV